MSIIVTNKLNFELRKSYVIDAGYLAPYRGCRYHCRIIGVGIGPVGRRMYLTMHTPRGEMLPDDFSTF